MSLKRKDEMRPLIKKYDFSSGIQIDSNIAWVIDHEKQVLILNEKIHSYGKGMLGFLDALNTKNGQYFFRVVNSNPELTFWVDFKYPHKDLLRAEVLKLINFKETKSG